MEMLMGTGFMTGGPTGGSSMKERVLKGGAGGVLKMRVLIRFSKGSANPVTVRSITSFNVILILESIGPRPTRVTS